MYALENSNMRARTKIHNSVTLVALDDGVKREEAHGAPSLAHPPGG